MADCQEFCLRWNNFQSNITHQFETLRDDEDFVDVTLTCGGKCIKAHKVVLSACSPYFKELLKNNPCKHPIIFMRDVEFTHLKALVAFMYAGVVNVEQAELASFLRTAEALHILGLTEAPQLHRDITNFPSKLGTGVTAPSSPPSGNSTAVSGGGSKEDGEESERTSPNESPSPPKKAKTANSSSCGTNDREQEAGRGWSGTGSTGETEENVPPGSIVQASSLFQQSRGGLVITPAEPPENDLDQSYNDDLVDMLEPKTELPDYSSDGESRTDAGSFLDNSADVHGFGTMNDIMSATSSQGATGQDGQPMESYQAALRKLHSLDPRPCPICQRMYSNLSNLRQHMRLIHIPQSVECPLCSRSFKTKLYLRRHLLSFHDIPVKWENSVAGVPGNPNAAGSNIISGLISQANAAPAQNAMTWSTSASSSTNSTMLMTSAANSTAASISLSAVPRSSASTVNTASSMPPPLPHAYLNVEEELKRTYLQSPHRVRSSCSVTVSTDNRQGQDDSNLGSHCIQTSAPTQSTVPTVHSSPGKEDNFQSMTNPFISGGLPLLQPKSEHVPDFMRSRFSGENAQQSQMGQFGGRVNYSNLNVPYSENT